MRALTHNSSEGKDFDLENSQHTTPCSMCVLLTVLSETLILALLIFSLKVYEDTFPTRFSARDAVSISWHRSVKETLPLYSFDA